MRILKVTNNCKLLLLTAVNCFMPGWLADSSSCSCGLSLYKMNWECNRLPDYTFTGKTYPALRHKLDVPIRSPAGLLYRSGEPGSRVVQAVWSALVPEKNSPFSGG